RPREGSRSPDPRLDGGCAPSGRLGGACVRLQWVRSVGQGGAGLMFMKGVRGDDDVDGRIRETLVDLRPLLHIAEATVELVRFEVGTGTALLRVEGDCPDCEMSAANT